MASARDADTFELESPFAEDFDALDEQDARLAPEAFDETPFTGEFELLAEDVRTADAPARRRHVPVGTGAATRRRPHRRS